MDVASWARGDTHSSATASKFYEKVEASAVALRCAQILPMLQQSAAAAPPAPPGEVASQAAAAPAAAVAAPDAAAAAFLPAPPPPPPPPPDAVLAQQAAAAPAVAVAAPDAAATAFLPVSPPLPPPATAASSPRWQRAEEVAAADSPPRKRSRKKGKVVQCVVCGGTMRRGQAFCGDCGSPGNKSRRRPHPPCSQCGADMEGNAFCGRCGTRGKEDTHAAARRSPFWRTLTAPAAGSNVTTSLLPSESTSQHGGISPQKRGRGAAKVDEVEQQEVVTSTIKRRRFSRVAWGADESAYIAAWLLKNPPTKNPARGDRLEYDWHKCVREGRGKLLPSHQSNIKVRGRAKVMQQGSRTLESWLSSDPKPITE